METLFLILGSGFFVSLISMAYLTLNARELRKNPLEGANPSWQEKEGNGNVFGVLFLSTGIFYVWCLIGIGLCFLLNDDAIIERLILFVPTTGILIYAAKIFKEMKKKKTFTVWTFFVLTVGTLSAILI
ncbi:MAG: hypothetical protein V3V31_02860 [Methylococcales bacterium]